MIPLQRAPALAPFLFQQSMDFKLQCADFDMARHACEKMKEEHVRRGLFSLDIIRAYLLMLIGIVCERYEKELIALAAVHQQRGHRADSLSRVIRYVRQNLSGRITLREATHAANVSFNHLTNLLKHETGKTFTELVTSRRMERACELLAYTPLCVSEIARLVGFMDEAYFTRRFRQYFRVPPLAYRSRAAPAALQ